MFDPGSIFDPTTILSGAGPWMLAIIAGMVFIETGLLFPFLPGDSLLFTAGLLAVPLGVPLPAVLAVGAAAAFLGDQVGYAIGRWLGPRLFRPGARVFKIGYRDRADGFFAKYGPRAL